MINTSGEMDRLKPGALFVSHGHKVNLIVEAVEPSGCHVRGLQSSGGVSAHPWLPFQVGFWRAAAPRTHMPSDSPDTKQHASI